MARKELTPEMRILLAFGISFLILVLSRPLLVRQTPPQKPAASNATAKTPEATPPESRAVAGAGGSAAAPAQPVQGEAEEEITVEGALYRVVFTTRGGVAKSWTLTSFKDDKGSPLELVHAENVERYGGPMSFWVEDEALRNQLNTALYAPSARGTLKAPVTLEFAYNSGGVAAHKKFVFAPDSYVVEIEAEALSDGKPVPAQISWPGSFGDLHDAGIRGTRWDVFYKSADQIVRLYPGNIHNVSFFTRAGQAIGRLFGSVPAPPPSDQVSATGQFAFAGVEDHFFCAAFVPEQQTQLTVTTFQHEITLPDEQRIKPQTVGVAVGGAGANRFRAFIGPKIPEVLAQVAPGLNSLIDYGWFWFVAQPLFYGLRLIHNHLIANYGWAIILLTVFINIILFPLKASSLRSARKMQQIQPQMRALQEKYKGMKMNDPRRQQMSQETMELYKKHGVNPLGGCLPLLLQIPFLYGFYRVLTVSIEMRHAPWISWWVPDLSAPEPFSVKFLPLLMTASQFGLQKMSPTPSADPGQQRMMLFMPLMFLVFFWNVSSGLVLYWLTGNLVSIAQQWYINRTELKQVIEQKRAATAAKKKRREE